MTVLPFHRHTTPCAATVLALALLLPAPPQLAAADLTSTYTIKPVKLGGGGWVTGVVVHPGVDNLVYCRTDVGGAYRWDATNSRWTQLIRSNSIPSEIVNATRWSTRDRSSEAYQVESIGIAPNNTNVLYLTLGGATDVNGWMVKSTDQGASWALVSTFSAAVAGNGEGRQMGERFAIKPDDANVVLYGTRLGGLLRSTNGGTSWASASGIPAGTQIGGHDYGIGCVVFDPSSSSRCFASVAGQGIYRSDDAGATWYQITSDWAFDLKIANNGTLYAANNTGFGVKRYTAAAGWVTVSAPQGDVAELAVDPANSARVYAFREGMGGMYRSIDSGGNWTLLVSGAADATAQSKFLGNTWKNRPNVAGYRSIGGFALDPRNSSRLWFAEGFGMWRSTDLSDRNNAPTFADISDGIEELVATDAVCPGGGRLITSVWDALGFTQTNTDTVPADKDLANVFTSGWCLAQMASNPAVVGRVVTNHISWTNGGDNNYTGMTWDKGASWSVLPGNSGGVTPVTGLRYGEMVVSASDSTKLVWHPRDGADKVFYSTNGGSAWNQSNIPVDDWDALFFGNRRRLAADGATNGTVYFYHWTDGAIYRSTDNGANFSDINGSSRLPGYNHNSQLKAKPGTAGELWYATGPGDSNDATLKGLYRSTSSGTSWSKIANVQDCWVIGFGAAKDANRPRTVFLFGQVSNVWGVFRSTDNGASWDQLCGHPNGLFDKVTVITGDPEVFGKFVIGFGGSGFQVGTPTTNGGGGGGGGAGGDGGDGTGPGGASDSATYSFESGTQSWINLWNSAQITSIASTTDKPYAGTKSLKIAISNTSGQDQYPTVGVTAPSGLAAGATVTFRYCVDSASVFAVQPFSQTSGNSWVATWVSPVTSGSWQTATVQLPANAGTINNLGFQLGVRTGYTGTAYIDSISWTSSSTGGGTPPPASSDSSRYHFETDSQGWANGWSNSAVTAVAVSTDQAAVGSKSLKITLNNTSGQTQYPAIFVNTPSGLAAGTVVTYRYYVPSGSGVNAVSPFTQTSNVSWTSTWNGSPTKGSWATVTLTMPANPGTFSNLGIQFGVPNGVSGSVYLDAVTW